MTMKSPNSATGRTKLLPCPYFAHYGVYLDILEDEYLDLLSSSASLLRCLDMAETLDCCEAICRSSVRAFEDKGYLIKYVEFRHLKDTVMACLSSARDQFTSAPLVRQSSIATHSLCSLPGLPVISPELRKSSVSTRAGPLVWLFG